MIRPRTILAVRRRLSGALTRRVGLLMALLGVPLAVAVLLGGEPTLAQTPTEPAELSLGWTEPLPTQRLDDASFTFSAVAPCAIDPAFWEHRASWEAPTGPRSPYDHDDTDQLDELRLAVGPDVDLPRLDGLKVGCDAQTAWTLPAVPPRGLQRSADGFAVTTDRDEVPGLPATPLEFTAPPAGQQVQDVTWDLAYHPSAPDPDNRPFQRTRVATVAFTVPTGGPGTVITLTAPNGLAFSTDPDDYQLQSPSLGPVASANVAVARALPNVVTIALAETITIPDGERLTLYAEPMAFPPPATYANTDFAVRTDRLPAPAHPERGVVVMDDGLTPATSVGELRLAVSSHEAGRAATWTFSFMTMTELRRLEGTITIEAPPGTQLPADSAAYSLAGVGLQNLSGGGSTVTLRTQTHLPPLTSAELRIEGVVNPSAGAYSHEAFAVRTSGDTRRAHPDAAVTFGPAGGNAVSETDVLPSDLTAGARASWRFRFRTSQIGGLGPSDAVVLSGPVGTVLPTDPARYWVQGHQLTGGVTRLDLHRVQVVVGEPIQPGDLLEVLVDGVVNPGTEPLPVAPLAIDSPSIEIPVSCGLRWDPPSPWPGTEVPTPFFDGTLANRVLGYGGNQLRCIAELEELGPSGQWDPVPGSRIELRTDPESEDPEEAVLPFELADGQFAATVRVHYEYWLAHHGTHPLVSTSQDPDPETPASSLDGYVAADQTADSVSEVYLWREQAEQASRWAISFRTTTGGGLTAGTDTIRLEAPVGFAFPAFDPGSPSYQVNGQDVAQVTSSEGGRIVEIRTPVTVGGGQLVTVEIQDVPAPAPELRSALFWDEPLRCVGFDRQQNSSGGVNPTTATEQRTCRQSQSDSMLHTDSVTSPVTLLLQPTALMQISVMPYKILYQPPGDQSVASFVLAQGSSTSTEFSVGEGQQTSLARNVYASVEHQGQMGLSFGPVGVNASFTYTDFWDTTTRQVQAQATQVTNSVTYAHEFTNAWQTSTLGAFGVPQLGDPGAQPWEWDQFVLLVNPQFAVWNRDGASVYQMIGTHAAEWSVSARTLWTCARGEPLPVPGDYYDDPDAQIILEPRDCLSLLQLDPFAAAERSSVDPSATLGPLVKPLQSLAQGAPGDGTNGTRTVSLTQTEAQVQSTDQTTDFTTQLTELAGNSYAIGVGAKLEIKGTGGGITSEYTLTGTLRQSTTTEVTTTVSYRQSRTTASSISQSVSVALADSHNPLLTTIWLDSRWGTLAFQVPAPTVTAVSPAQGVAGGLVELTGQNFWTGPAWVDFCPATGPCVEAPVVEQRTDQKLIVEAPDLPAGTVVDVVAHGPGGPSTTTATFTYATSGSGPGPGGGGGSGGAPGPPPALPPSVSAGPFSGTAGDAHDVVLEGSGIGAEPLVVYACALDGSICTVLPGAESLDEDHVRVTLPPLGPGSVQLVVHGPGGPAQLDGSPTFTYRAAGPRITSLDPPSGPAAGGTPVTIAGSDLARATRVQFGDVDADFVLRADGTLLACAPPTAVAGPTRSVTVRVTTPDGTSPGGDAALFTYAAEGGALPCTLPAPTTTPQVTRVTPGFGPATGGTPIRIEGVGFQLVGEPRTFADGSEGTLLAPPPVYVDGTPATDVRFVGATALEAVVPPGTPGTATVRVGGPSGLSPATDAATFLYVTDAGCLRCDDEDDPHALDLWVTRPHAVGDGADPVVRVAAVTDARGRPVSGVPVTFGQQGGTRASTTVTTDRYGQARARVAGAAPGDLTFTASVPGVAATARTDATFWPVPRIDLVTPLTLPAAGGETITISGTAFDGVTAVHVGAAVIDRDGPGWGTLDTSGDPHVLTITAPPGVGTVQLAVANPAVTSSPVSVTYTGGHLDDLAPGLFRIAGDDRFATAAELSRAAFPSGVDVVHVATGGAFADALAGGVAAALENGPMLLVGTDHVPEATAAELARLRPGRIVVLGGEAAVSQAVATALQHYTGGAVTRLWGPDRFATAAAISAATFPDGADVVYVGTGLDFPDALAGVPAAVRGPGPVLLTAATVLPDATANELARLDPDRIVVLGGTAAIDPAVEAALAGFAPVERVAGADRFDTAARVSAHAFASPDTVDTVFIATGTAFPDALAGGAVAGSLDAPLLLTGTSSVPAPTLAELDRLAPQRIVVLGGPAAVDPSVEGALAAHLQTPAR